MYYTIKTLLKKGQSQREVARILGIHRKTVKKIKQDLDKGQFGPQPQRRSHKLEPYTEAIRQGLANGKTAVLIYQWLKQDQGLDVSYPTVARFIRLLKPQEVYVPLYSEPGEEAQVDFGYLGRFEKEGRKVKTWCFVMTLSHSRYSYWEVVTDQSVKTFIQCHIHAFEYFSGVPATVKIDNLKAGVIHPSFYEPQYQHQYNEFLQHYGSDPITARPRRPQDKGKVESGVKYCKNNFLKRKKWQNFYRLQRGLNHWMNEIANKRCHGTTHKTPVGVFEATEMQALRQLPSKRYEVWEIASRKVTRMGHISWHYNYYSVPWSVAGEQVTVKTNGQLLHIYSTDELIAVHALAQGYGHYISKAEHRPPYKQRCSEAEYNRQVNAIGDGAEAFLSQLKEIKPRHWHEMMAGILALRKNYDKDQINLACHRALNYGAISYREVKTILEKKLYRQEAVKPAKDQPAGGFGHHLAQYDQLNTN